MEEFPRPGIIRKNSTTRSLRSMIAAYAKEPLPPGSQLLELIQSRAPFSRSLHPRSQLLELLQSRAPVSMPRGEEIPEMNSWRNDFDVYEARITIRFLIGLIFTQPQTHHHYGAVFIERVIQQLEWRLFCSTKSKDNYLSLRNFKSLEPQLLNLIVALNKEMTNNQNLNFFQN